MQPKTIFFDFDGVLLDTVEAKGRAIAKAFASFGTEMEKKVLEYHLNHGGMNRRLKVQQAYKLFVGREISESELESTLLAIAKDMRDELFRCQPVKGALEFMRKHKNNSGNVWIVSAAPQDELNELTQHFGYAPYTNGIYGFPNKKSDVIRDLIITKHLKTTECLMIGDAQEDFNAAKDNNISFLLRKTPFSSFSNSYSAPSIIDFTEAETAIANL